MATKQQYKPDFLLAIPVASTSMGANDYLRRQCKIMKADPKTSPDLLPVLDAVLKAVEKNEFMLRRYSNTWGGGTTPKTPIQNYYHNLGANALDRLNKLELNPEQQVKILFHYAIGDQANFLRGLSSPTGPLNPKVGQIIDQLFESWLAANNISSKEGVLYLNDSSGNQTRVKPKDFLELIAEGTDGFGKKEGYGRELGACGIIVKTKRQEYPVQAPKDTAAESASVVEKAKPVPPTQGPAPDEPEQRSGYEYDD